MACLPIFFNSNKMTKNKIFISFSLLFLLVFALGSCKDKPKVENKTAFEMSLTNQDSVEVRMLIDQFFQYVEHGQASAAASMLVKLSPKDPYADPRPLNNDEMKEVLNLVKSLPIKSHEIDYIKFSESFENEVKVTALIHPAQDGLPEVKTVFYFKPVDYLNKWKLSIIDSHSDDKTIVDRDKKDSMKNAYQKEMRVKEMSKNNKD